MWFVLPALMQVLLCEHVQLTVQPASLVPVRGEQQGGSLAPTSSPTRSDERSHRTLLTKELS